MLVQPELNSQPPAWQPGAQTTEESKSSCQRRRLQAMSILSIRLLKTYLPGDLHQVEEEEEEEESYQLLREHVQQWGGMSSQQKRHKDLADHLK